MQSNFVYTNGIRLHYLHYPGNGPVVILMHGLTANAHAFDGLVEKGLSPAFALYSVDLRGRGLSDAPVDGYTMADHAADIIGLLDELQLERAHFAGHSFGALLTLYLAAHHPSRVSSMILLDAGAKMHPNTRAMLEPAMSRLGQTYASFEVYLDKVKQAPYLEIWEEAMSSYYRADVTEMVDGTVRTIPHPDHMAAAVGGALAQPWPDFLRRIKHPALLINGPGIYTMGAALLPEENARETAAMLPDCRYVAVPGNHQTMLYGRGAVAIIEAMKAFLPVLKTTSTHSL
jgi:pimeloyl-ACP methyl ester carboxylesterase